MGVNAVHPAQGIKAERSGRLRLKGLIGPVHASPVHRQVDAHYYSGKFDAINFSEDAASLSEVHDIHSKIN